MNYGIGFIRVFKSKKVEEKLGICSKFNDEENKILKIEKDGIYYKDDKTKEFYEKYENELNSFRMEDLKKIYDETGICIYRVIRYLKPSKDRNAKDIDIAGLCIQPTSIYYWDYDEYNIKHEYYRDAKGYKEKRKMLDKLIEKSLKDDDDSYCKTGEYDEFFIDAEYLTFAEKLAKDDTGIYIVNDNQKKYVYHFKKKDLRENNKKCNKHTLRDQLYCQKN